MLTTDGFPYPVEQLYQGRKAYWVFRGVFYRDYEHFVAMVQAAEEAYLAPGSGIMNVHQEKLDHGKCELVAALVQIQGESDKWLRYPEDFPDMAVAEARGFTTNYAYLRHFGLLEHAASNHKTRGAKWRVTSLGRAFILQDAPVPRYILNKGPNLLSVSEKTVRLSDLFPEDAIEIMRHEPHFWH